MTTRVALDRIYLESECIMPRPGRYKVDLCLAGQKWIVLEKKIRQGNGSNYLPFFSLRHFKINLMDFSIHIVGEEVVFSYPKIPLEERLRRIDFNQYLGKIFYRGRFMEYFMMVKC